MVAKQNQNINHWWILGGSIIIAGALAGSTMVIVTTVNKMSNNDFLKDYFIEINNIYTQEIDDINNIVYYKKEKINLRNVAQIAKMYCFWGVDLRPTFAPSGTVFSENINVYNPEDLYFSATCYKWIQSDEKVMNVYSLDLEQKIRDDLQFVEFI